jgi:hypothetical protein
MRNPFLAASLAACALACAAAAQGDRWFTVSPADNFLRQIDPYTAATLSSVPMTTGSATVNAANGLAVHPGTNELWAILQLQGSGGNRALARVNPQTGVATVVGMTGMQFANITFDVTGRLFGVTGDGASTPETLFTLDLTTAAPTFFQTLGNGSDGEAICYHLPTNSLFHASGLGTPNVTEIFERFDIATRTTTNLPISGGDWDEVLCLAHFTGDNFLVADLNLDLWTATTSGRINMIGSLDHDAKGLVNLRGTGGAYFAIYGGGCRAPNGVIPMLGGSGTPSSNANVTFRVLNGPANAASVLTLGLGTTPFPITASCSLQNLALTPVAAPFTLDASGVFNFPLTVPFVAAPFDAYFQVAMVASGQFAVSNPLRVHLQ